MLTLQESMTYTSPTHSICYAYININTNLSISNIKRATSLPDRGLFFKQEDLFFKLCLQEYSYLRVAIATLSNKYEKHKACCLYLGFRALKNLI